MPRMTVEANDALRQKVWGEFRLPQVEALDRVRARVPARKEIAEIIAQLQAAPGIPGAPGAPGAGLEYPTGLLEGAPLRDRLRVINSETFAVSLASNTPGNFSSVACTSPLPFPSVITQLVLALHKGTDYITWQATLVPADISADDAPEIQGTPLIDARWPDLGSTLGVYPILGSTSNVRPPALTTIKCYRLIEQAGQRIALWVSHGANNIEATLYVTVGVFDPSVTAADIVKAALPRRKAWQYGEELAEEQQAARIAEETERALTPRPPQLAQTIIYNITQAAPRVSAPPPRTPTKTITVQASPYPRAIIMKVIQGGRILSQREVSWAALSPALKAYWINNQAAGRADPTMEPIW